MYFDGSAYFRAIGIDDFFLGDGASLEGGEVSGEEMGLRLSETEKYLSVTSPEEGRWVSFGLTRSR